jgi:hypothetical protein
MLWCRQVTCTEGGTCLSNTPSSSDATSPGSASTNSSAVAGSAKAPTSTLAVKRAIVNQGPRISLLTSDTLPSVVQIKRGAPYERCVGVQPSLERPCELGATASDPDGAGTASSPADTDLTPRIVVCPPKECLASGCSPQVLRAHYFTVKGLKGCGIDTMASQGTEYLVDFWVWDGGYPVKNASTTRTLVLSNPCPSSSSSYFCEDNNGAHFCSGELT